MKIKSLNLTLLLFLTLSCSIAQTNTVNLAGETIIKSFPMDKSLFEEKTDDEFHIIIETAPTFPGCESEKGNGLKSCYYKKANAFIRSNIQYPEVAKKNMIQGRVIAKYIINKKGLITNVSVKGNEYLVDEVIRLVKSLPKVTPAKQKGRAVGYEIALPVHFKLGDK